MKIILLVWLFMTINIVYSHTQNLSFDTKPNEQFNKNSSQLLSNINEIRKEFLPILDTMNSQKLIKKLDSLEELVKRYPTIYEGDVINKNDKLKEFEKKYLEKIQLLSDSISIQYTEIQGLKSKATTELIYFVDNFLKEKNAKDLANQQLSKDKDYLFNQLNSSKENVLRYEGQLARARDSIQFLLNTEKRLNHELQYFNSVMKIGLSFGFNSFFNNQLDYIVNTDSTVSESGDRFGLSGIVSAVVSIRLDSIRRWNLIINVPLEDFTKNPDQAIGVFNKRMAVGLGLGWRPFDASPNLQFGLIFNISPYSKLNFEKLRNVKVSAEPFTKLNPDNFGSSQAQSFSLSFCTIYTF